MSLTPLNTESEFEFSPPQSPVLRPADDAANKSPTTPKRKREADGANESPSKRSSPLQQVATPGTLDLASEEQPLTPMKRSSSFQKATPVTLVKGVNRVQLDSHSSPNGVGIVDSFNSESGRSLPPMVKPRLIDFNASSKSKASVKAGSAVIPVIDLDSDSTGDEIDHASVIKGGATKKQTMTPATPSTSEASPTTPASQRLPSNQDSRLVNPTPTVAATPSSLSALHKIPAIAPAYVPVYVSPDSPVKLRDSKQFCIKPPFWKRWPRDQYRALAHYLEENIDLVPFAAQENLTVEEVQHIYQAVVVEPLLDETEKLAAVGQKRIENMFKAYDKTKGKSWRKWGDDDISVEGDLGGVRPGIVQLTGKNADLIEVPFRKLKDVDKEFVLSLLSEEELAILKSEVV
jgi:hypothetical protein